MKITSRTQDFATTAGNRLVVMKNKELIYVAGPTAVGKTAFSIVLAKAFQTEIVSCDSRQFYKEMQIGTAVPSKEELSAVKHHCIHHLSIKQTYSIGDYEKEALGVLESLFKKNDRVILIGGSGMYADAMMNGLDDFPKIPNSIRVDLEKTLQTEGIGKLQSMLQEKDPVHFKNVDLQNPHRLIRALEICLATHKPYSSYLNKQKSIRPFTSRILLLRCDRSQLYERIDKRVDKMLAEGLEKEARKLHPMRHLQALNTVGYKEFFDYFEGKTSYDEAINEIKKNTRRYAKRQMTWFRRYTEAIKINLETPLEKVLRLLE